MSYYIQRGITLADGITAENLKIRLSCIIQVGPTQSKGSLNVEEGSKSRQRKTWREKGPPAKECQQSPEAGKEKARKQILPESLQVGSQHLDSSPLCPSLDSDLQNCKTGRLLST